MRLIVIKAGKAIRLEMRLKNDNKNDNILDAPKPPAGLGAAPNPPKVDIVMVLWYYGVATVIDIIKMDLLDGVDRPLCVCVCVWSKYN